MRVKVVVSLLMHSLVFSIRRSVAQVVYQRAPPLGTLDQPVRAPGCLDGGGSGIGTVSVVENKAARSRSARARAVAPSNTTHFSAAFRIAAEERRGTLGRFDGSSARSFADSERVGDALPSPLPGAGMSPRARHGRPTAAPHRRGRCTRRSRHRCARASALARRRRERLGRAALAWCARWRVAGRTCYNCKSQGVIRGASCLASALLST